MKTNDFYWKKVGSKLTKIDEVTGEVLEELDLSPNQFAIYTEANADIICEDIINGKTLQEIMSKYGIEYATLNRWRKRYPNFTKQLDMAFQDRALLLAEDIRSLSPDGCTRDDLEVLKFKRDNLKWLAQTYNPAKYDPKTKASQELAEGVNILIETGIRRTGDDGYVAQDEKELKNVTAKTVAQSTDSSSDSDDSGNSTENNIDENPYEITDNPEPERIGEYLHSDSGGSGEHDQPDIDRPSTSLHDGGGSLREPGSPDESE